MHCHSCELFLSYNHRWIDGVNTSALFWFLKCSCLGGLSSLFITGINPTPMMLFMNFCQTTALNYHVNQFKETALAHIVLSRNWFLRLFEMCKSTKQLPSHIKALFSLAMWKFLECNFDPGGTLFLYSIMGSLLNKENWTEWFKDKFFNFNVLVQTRRWYLSSAFVPEVYEFMISVAFGPMRKMLLEKTQLILFGRLNDQVFVEYAGVKSILTELFVAK